jgi:hypothetical protein
LNKGILGRNKKEILSDFDFKNNKSFNNGIFSFNKKKNDFKDNFSDNDDLSFDDKEKNDKNDFDDYDNFNFKNKKNKNKKFFY